MKAYHIDRKNLLTPNKIIGLNTSIRIDPVILQTQLENAFPDGVSNHGDQYFASHSNKYNAGNFVYESAFEYERKLRFSDKISRYQAFFGIKTVDDLKIWLNFFSNNDTSLQKQMAIWEIDTLDSTVQEFDASFIGGGDLSDLQHLSQLAGSL
jgi:hypothetical protein